MVMMRAPQKSLAWPLELLHCALDAPVFAPSDAAMATLEPLGKGTGTTAAATEKASKRYGRHRRIDAEHFLLKRHARRAFRKSRTRVRHERAWVGSPSTFYELTFSASANRHILNEQRIPPHPFAPDPYDEHSVAREDGSVVSVV